MTDILKKISEIWKNLKFDIKNILENIYRKRALIYVYIFVFENCKVIQLKIIYIFISRHAEGPGRPRPSVCLSVRHF